MSQFSLSLQYICVTKQQFHMKETGTPVHNTLYLEHPIQLY
jgi:hypothetical protein